MFLTSSKIRCYLSIASTAIALSVATSIFSNTERASLYLESPREITSSLETESQEKIFLSPVWRDVKNFKIAEGLKLRSEVYPSKSIDWSQTKIKIDSNLQLNF